MLSSESTSSQTSTTVRNLTYFHNRSASQLPHRELPIDATYGDSRSSIDAPPTISAFRPSLNTTTHPKIEEDAAVHGNSIHRRAKTETLSLPTTTPRPNCNEHLNRLDEVNLEPNTEQKITSPRSSRPGTRFTGLFQGESAPIRFGLIRSYAEEATTNNTDRPNTSMEMTESLPSRAQSKFTKRMSMPSPLKQVSSSARFSFFGHRPQSQDSTRGQLPEPADDEFLNLDVGSVLFPSGSADLPAPEALKTLQYNAERVIGQLQAAYKLRTFALHEALAEKSSLGEELEETQSRLLNIKNQLNGMAEKVDEQDKAMKTMAEELKLERRKRQENEEEEARKRSIVLVREPEPAHYQDHSHHLRCSCATKDGSRDSLETKSIKRHSKRSSAGTFYSDSGFESGDESTAESIFSRKYENLGSPATLATRASGASSPDIGFSIAPLPSLSEDQLAPPQPQPQQSTTPSKPTAPATKPSAYDRVLRGISSASLSTSFMSSSPFSTSRCSNCHGATASDAWGVVSVLKDENRGLKNRIGELEAAVDECITLVGG